MCKNEDEVKELKYELERYRKKVGDQEKRIAELTARCERADRGNRETHMAANALQAAVALKYGEDATDPDQPGRLLGKRLTLPAYGITDMLRQYEVRAGKDRDGNYVIGVCPKEEARSKSLPPRLD